MTWTAMRQYISHNPHPCFLRQDNGGGGGAGGGDKPGATSGDKPTDGSKDDAGDKPADADDDDDDADEPLGDAGKGALKKERDARRAAEAAAKKSADDLAAVTKRLDEIETKDLDETERQLRRLPTLEADVARLTGELDQANAALTEERLERTVEREAAKDETRFTDPEDALAFLDRSAIEHDDEGKPKPGSIRKELKRILAAKPHLAATQRDAEEPAADETPAAPAANNNGATADDENKVKETTRGFLRRRV